MGCCAPKKKELKELEEELAMLLQQKRSIEAKSKEIEESTEKSSADLRSDIGKIIDHDQSNTLEIVDGLAAFTSSDPEMIQKINKRILEISTLSIEKKLIEYSQFRSEVSETQKLIVKDIEMNVKRLREIVELRISDIEDRAERVERVLGEIDYFDNQRRDLKARILDIKSEKGLSVSLTLDKLEKVISIDEVLSGIEAGVPRLSKNESIMGRIKELEVTFADLVKTSIHSYRSIGDVLGSNECSESSENINVISLKTEEINTRTYISIAESLIDFSKKLKELEDLKKDRIFSNKINESLAALDHKLSNHFSASEKHQENISAKLRRISRDTPSIGLITAELIKHTEISNKTIDLTVDALKEKTEKFLQASECNDKAFIEITDNFEIIEKHFDEIEYKFQELLSAEFKDFYKSVPHSNQPLRAKIDEVKDKLESKEEKPVDLLKRLEELNRKFDIVSELDNLRNFIRESWNADIIKIKGELNEKSTECSHITSQFETEKHKLETLLQSTKANLEKTSEVADKLIKSNGEKEIEITTLKNTISSLNEALEQSNTLKNQIQDEIEELQKNLREAKKNLRIKENEVLEIKTSIEAELTEHKEILKNKNKEIEELNLLIKQLNEASEIQSKTLNEIIEAKASSENELKDLKTTLINKNEEIKEMNQLVMITKNELNKEIKIHEELKDRVKGTDKEFSETTMALTKELHDAKLLHTQLVSSSEKDKERFQTEKCEFHKEVHDLKEKLKKKKHKLIEAKESLKKKSEEFEEISQSNNKYKHDLEEVHHKLKESETNHHRLLESKDLLEKEFKDLKESLKSE